MDQLADSMSDSTQRSSLLGEWKAPIDPNRWVAVFRFGPYRVVYGPPLSYVKRLFCRVIPLKPVDWVVSRDIELLGGFCTVQSKITVFFQPKVRYVSENVYILPDVSTVSEYIKSHYDGLVKNIIVEELKRAEDGILIENLEETKRRIVSRVVQRVNETLTEQGIDCNASCDLEFSFKAMPENETYDPAGHFLYEKEYLEIMRRVLAPKSSGHGRPDFV